ncbi:uncharacterized protein LOC121652517 [Melanotaenia boesemani]|uniref:uncharacterized protein LOC121652517 n=1 Tax=Melanotaenia boesemani TaxID=1250792 RepID=UPI001C0541F5|nr:uncharacterized protein LOC121652517 [Melanotaenia boesemani]
MAFTSCRTWLLETSLLTTFLKEQLSPWICMKPFRTSREIGLERDHHSCPQWNSHWQIILMQCATSTLTKQGGRFALWFPCKIPKHSLMLLDYFLVTSGIHLEIGHSLKPLRLISRVPSLKLLSSIIVDILPMLGHVFLLLMHVIHIFGVKGVNLWTGKLRNRCFLGEDIVTMYNLSLSPYFDQGAPFVFSRHSSTGERHCKDVPPYREHGNICTLAAPHQDKPGGLIHFDERCYCRHRLPFLRGHEKRKEKGVWVCDQLQSPILQGHQAAGSIRKKFD